MGMKDLGYTSSQATEQTHYCDEPGKFPLNQFLQLGSGKGSRILVVGESPAPNGWRVSGKACYTPEGKLLPTGRNLNKLLDQFGLSVEICAFTELAKCYVGKDRKLLDACCQGCWPIFLEQLELIDPTLVIVMGVKTTAIFNSLADSDLKVGTVSKVSLEGRDYTILPIYHPSPIAPKNHGLNTNIFHGLDPKLF